VRFSVLHLVNDWQALMLLAHDPDYHLATAARQRAYQAERLVGAYQAVVEVKAQPAQNPYVPQP